MGGKMSRNKGQRGEREAAALLQPIVNEVYVEAGFAPPLFKRNLMQTREGGYDIVGLDWLALEIKRQETLSISTWWKQTLKQAGEEQTPVLMYRKNHAKWRVMLLLETTVGLTIPVDITLSDFLEYFSLRIALELKNNS